MTSERPKKKEEMISKKRWNALYRSGAEKEWGTRDEHISEVVQLFLRRGAKTVLDLGCGSGRHVLYLTKHGFLVYGIDLSSEGIRKTKQFLRERGLSAKVKVGSIYQPLPYPNAFFDAVISIHTFHHAHIQDIRRAINELQRILKQGGMLFVTVRKRTSKKHRHPFKEIAPHTYVPLEGREKGIVHYLFTKALLRKEFNGFKIHKLWIDEKGYYCLLGELRGKKTS